MDQDRIIKICGIKSIIDMNICLKASPTTLGFNFFSHSPRSLTPQVAQPLLATIPPSLQIVGVFVRPDPLHLIQITSLSRFHALQLHGCDLDYFRRLTRPPAPLWIAHATQTLEDLDELRRIIDFCHSAKLPLAAVLIDAKSEGLHGGTGQPAPWHLLRDLQLPVPWILAGGLTPKNVAQAILQVHPAGVDVATGVESSPGVKDPAKVLAFIQNARAAFQSVDASTRAPGRN
jgi:phosphoribosylanthranilate isomerase